MPINASLSRNALIIAIAIGIALILLTTVLMNNGSNDNPAATVKRIYFADNISVAHQKLIDAFNEKHAGRIEVVPVNLPFTKFTTNERKELLARSLRSKSDQVDIFAVDIIWASRFAKWAAPIDLYFTRTDLEAFLPEALESCFHDSTLVAVPLYIDIGLMYYRTDLIRGLPNGDELEQRIRESLTWEELIELGGKTKRLNKPVYLFSGKAFEGLVCSFIELIASQGGSIMSGDSVDLNTPVAVKSLQLLSDLINRYDITPAVVTNYDEVQCYTYSLENDALFFRGWAGFHETHVGEARLDMIESAPLPHLRGSEALSVFGGWNLMISRNSQHVTEAIEFIRYLQEVQSQKLLFESGGYIPINQHVYSDSAFLASSPRLKTYLALLARGVHRPLTENYTKISDILSYYLHKALIQEMSVTEALRMATLNINSQKVILN